MPRVHRNGGLRPPCVIIGLSGHDAIADTPDRCHSIVVRFLLILAVVFLMAAGPLPPRSPTKLSESEVQKCTGRGGRIMTMGLSGNEGCVTPTPDAGHSCTDMSECTAGCYLDTTRPGFRWPKPNQRVTGICAATTYGFGCKAAVVRGKAQPSICID